MLYKLVSRFVLNECGIDCLLLERYEDAHDNWAAVQQLENQETKIPILWGTGCVSGS